VVTALETESPETSIRLNDPGSATQGGGVPEGKHVPEDDSESSPLVLIAYTTCTAEGLGDGPGIGCATGRYVSPQAMQITNSAMAATMRTACHWLTRILAPGLKDLEVVILRFRPDSAEFPILRAERDSAPHR